MDLHITKVGEIIMKEDINEVFKDSTIWQWFHDNGFEGLRVNNDSILELKKVLENVAYTIGKDAKFYATKRGKATIRKEDVLKAYEKYKVSRISDADEK